MSRLVSPAELSRDALVEIVSKVQGRLYLDLDEHGAEFWNPGKEWSCWDVCQDIQDTLHEYDLVPGEGQSSEEAAPAPRGNKVQMLAEWAESNGVKPEDLDILVHDCSGTMASEINSRGIAEQIKFLINQLGESDTRAQLADAVDVAGWL